MKENIIKSLRALFPFLSVIFLWRLNIPFWNPGGILAIIPIFYCTFIKPVPWFMPFGLIFSFLIDYNLGALCYWTCIYCLCYALNGFQTFIDLQHRDFNSVDMFTIYIGLGLVFFIVPNLNWTIFGRTLWLFIYTTLLYMPITRLIDRVQNDR